MKKLLLIIPFLLFTLFTVRAQEDFRKAAPAAGPAPKIQLGTYQEFTLVNGLKCIVVENHKLPRVSFQISLELPMIKEGDYAGAADMAGQLLKTGTKTKTKAQIDEAVDFIGANLSTSASGVSGSSLSRHKDKMLAIMSDVLLNPSFPQAEFDKLKKQTLSGLAQAKDDPNAIADNVSQVVRFGKNHPYGELTTETTVEKITLDRAKQFYQTYFKPNISYLVIVGDIKPAEAKVLAEKYFGKWVKGTVAKQNYEKPVKPQGAKVDFVNKTGAVQSVVNITYPLEINQSNPDYIKASVANTLLGGYFSSRLNANIREDKGYSYGVNSQFSPDKEIGYFEAGGSVRNEVTDSAVVEFLKEMNRLSDEKVDATELTMVKNVMTGSFARGLEQPGTIARFALNIARYNLPKDYYATYLQKLSQVTADDIQAAAKKYITPANAHIVIVGDKSAVAERLKPFSTGNEVDFYDPYGNKIQITTSAVAADMTAQKVIDRYIEVIGGKDKLAAIKDITMKMTAPIQGMSLEIISKQKAPNKLVVSTMMNGAVMMEQKFDGTNGVVSQMGQKQKLEGKDAEDMKGQAVLFAESQYQTMGYKLALKGIEQVEGKNAYQVEVTAPSGGKSTEFYDVTTGFKIREVETSGEGANAVTTINDYDDYKEVSGVKFPHKITLTGAAPFAISSTVNSIEINKGIEDAAFKVE